MHEFEVTAESCTEAAASKAAIDSGCMLVGRGLVIVWKQYLYFYMLYIIVYRLEMAHHGTAIRSGPFGCRLVKPLVHLLGILASALKTTALSCILEMEKERPLFDPKG